jgi:hypothetical protein
VNGDFRQLRHVTSRSAWHSGQIDTARLAHRSHIPTSARVPISIRAFYRIRSMTRRKTAKTYTDYLREQPSRLSDFERESCAADALLREKSKKPIPKQVEAVHCPTCGARPGQRCELALGQPRTEPHRDRRLIAAD